VRPALPPALDRVHERLFVAGYTWIQDRSEAAGMREARAAVVGRAAGAVMEVGAGTGLNLDHYGPAVDELLLVEPAPAMRAVLEDEVARGRPRPGPGSDDGPLVERHGPAEAEGARAARPAARPWTTVAAGTGEDLPAADGSVDAVVATFVLCSVADPVRVLAEVARVLRPGGLYLGLEHVRSGARRVARAQTVVAPAWRVLARGCRCDQDAVALLRGSPLTVEQATSFRGPRQPWPVRPGVQLVARR
jgi:SAM-dependent methyltransferase